MNSLNWTQEEIESLTINTLERAIESGNLDPLLINDGHIIGSENAETPAAGTAGESM
ncbi:hypothetical protein [Lacrimispora sp.]|uniref:hypothetical protein n=1 Tax=Lacrimispora sp. TaxID=2719234 RepID=UPI0029DF4B84|nr:hypothetical protein [Lacrimispora sp.]